MNGTIVEGILLPFWGTALGAGSVFLSRKLRKPYSQRLMNGFAAGIMLAASVWSLLLPALQSSAAFGRLAFLPASVGCFAGLLFLRLTERIGDRLFSGSEHKSRHGILLWAVTLHNLPEGMAVGVIWAGVLWGKADIAGALALSAGIAIQNIPEGAIVSLPQLAKGKTKITSFLSGVASGVVEPLGALLTLVAAEQATAFLPWLLGFAAGAMLYAVISELIPCLAGDFRNAGGYYAFFGGFLLMMALDTALS